MHKKLIAKINKAAKRRRHGISKVKVFAATTYELRTVKE